MIIDYQRKLRESSESVNAAEEHSRKLTMEVTGCVYQTVILTVAIYKCFANFIILTVTNVAVYTYCFLQVSMLKLEKEMLANAEKRACDEVRALSERVHRLQVYSLIDFGFVSLLLYI